jgi:hypothetical protein
MLPYSIANQVVHSPKGTWRSYPEREEPNTGTVMSCFGPLYSWDNAGLRDRVVAKAVNFHYQNLKGLGLESMVSLAELPKTIGLITHTATRVAHAMKAFKRFDVTGAYDALSMSHDSVYRGLTTKANKSKSRVKGIDFAANSILEVKYGWKPLLYDIDNAAQALAKSWENDTADVRVHAHAEESYGVIASVNPQLEFTVAGNGSVKANTVAYYRVLDSKLRNANSLGLTNLASVAWELVPYSFVLDWVSPVGDFLSSLSALSGVEEVRSCLSVKTEETGSTNVYKAYGSSASMNASSRSSSFVRTLGIPNRSVILQSRSDFGKLVTADKAITSLALLRAAFR